VNDLGTLLREFDECTPSWSKEDVVPRQIVASPQFITKANKGRFKKGFESFLNDLQQLMIDNDIVHVYLSETAWEIIYRV
jgi:hypothetical protein